MPTGFYKRTVEYRRKMSEVMKEKSWNRGLTKESDQRVKLAGEKTSKGLKKAYKEGRKKGFEKGHPPYYDPTGTKKTKESLEKQSATIRKQYAMGERVTWNKGITHSEETRKKISDAHKGRKFSEERRKQMSLSRKGKTNSGSFKKGRVQIITGEVRRKIGLANKKNWSNPDYAAKMMKAFFKRPTSLEKKITELIKENDLNFEYVGNGKFWIKNDADSFNPDFVDIEKKLIIEVFGDYWHNLEQNKHRDKKRLIAYSKNGYNTLVIWGHEIEGDKRYGEKLSKEDLLDRIKCFNPTTKFL